MNLIKDYMCDEALRQELNALTMEVFGFHFEDWVTGGYYEGDYIPYSYEEDGKLIANVSVNRMEFLQNGVKKNYIQLGTVMTGESHRKRGYASELMKLVIAEYRDKCDGIYLFGNMEALEFYDKLGFTRGLQYRYHLREDVKQRLPQCSNPFLRAEGEDHKARYQQALRKCAGNSPFAQCNQYGLQMFYTAGLEQIYYSPELDCYIAMEMEGNTLFLQSVISGEPIPLEQILSRIPAEYDDLILGFTPCASDEGLFYPEAYDGEDDYRFFFLGDELKSIEDQKLYFPAYSHA